MDTWLDKSMRHNPLIDKCCAEKWTATGQNLGHMPRIYHICSKLHPKVIVETGVGGGGHGSSTYTFLVIAQEMNAHLTSIDNSPQNEWFRKRFPNLDYSHWTFIQKDSLEALENFNGKIDFLHLDSDHSYQHVTEELMATEKKMSKKHVIASHDTETTQPECRRAMHEWAEKHDYTLTQFEDWHGETFLTRNIELLEGLI